MSAPVFDFAEPLLLLVAGVVLSGLVSGIILLIIGLAQNRRGLWLGGLVTTVASVCLIGAMGVMLLLLAVTVRSAPVPPPAAIGIATAPAAMVTLDGVPIGPPPAEPGELLGPTGARDELAGVRVFSVRTEDVGWSGVLLVPEGFGDVLAEHFEKGNWAQVPEAMKATPGPPPPWGPEKLPGRPFWRRSFVHGGRRFTAYVLYDQRASRAWCYRMDHQALDAAPSANTNPPPGAD